jgi:hypothetical protein
MKPFHKLSLLRAALVAFAFPAFSQNFPNGFNFYLPPHDTTSASFLPNFPVRAIAANDFVATTPAGEFAVRGNPLRFFGTNLVADGAFPPKNEGAFVAGRLRKFGFNLVRLHHLDNPWAQSLFEQGGDTRHLNPQTLDRLEHLIAQLKAHGVYVNMNLHVSRTFRAADGVADADSVWNYGKGVTIFDPQLRALQKEYAAQLLTHVNPYTGLALAHDPVMAMVEITNENLLYGMWRGNVLKPFSHGGELTVRHDTMLNDLWQQFLRAKYGNTNALAQAWNQGTSSGDNQVRNGGYEAGLSPWRVELHGSASALATTETSNAYRGQASARINVTAIDGTNWHVQWLQTMLSMKKDSAYAVSFAARSDRARSIFVGVQQNSSPYTFYTGAAFNLTTNWQRFTFSFIAPATMIGDTKLAFMLGDEAGHYWFDDVAFGRTAVQGLEANESLESNTVRRLDYGEANAFTTPRVADMTAFYIKLQNDFFDEMAGYLKNALGVRAPITSTNLYAGLPDLAVQSRMDYVDNHNYWDHPQFPNEPWSSTDWLINNTAMVRDPGFGGGTIPYLFAGTAAANKPFTVSEYNHAFPNRYQAEGALFLTAYSAFHRADGLMFFDYNSASDWQTDFVDGYFSLHRNSVMMALMPSCAYAYREGLIRGAQQTLLARYHPDDVRLAPKRETGFALWRPYGDKLAVQHAIVNETFESATPANPSQFPNEPSSPYVTDTGEIVWNTDGLLQVVTPRFIAATGFFNEFANETMGEMRLLSGSDFGACTWLSLSEKPLVNTSRSLFTLVSQAQNTGMVWDGINTIHDDWGRAPTQILPLQLEVEFHLPAEKLRVYPLTATGEATATCLEVLPSAPNTFRVLFDQTKTPTLWFGLEAVGNSSEVTDETQSWDYALEQNFPNPFNAGTSIRFSMKHDERVRLSIYDMAGNEVHRETKLAFAGWNCFKLDDARLASGAYVYEVAGQGFSLKKKMLLLR